MLEFSTILYLAVPYFFFFIGWLWWPYAALLTLGLLIALRRSWIVFGNKQDAQGSAQTPSQPWFKTRDGIAVALVTLVLVTISGAGGIAPQQMDWRKHNAVLHDLTVNNWPVVLERNDAGSPLTYLTYYFAYYLPAGFVGRLFGLTAAHLALYAWTLIGLLLSSRWVPKLTGGPASIVWVGWFLLAGMDVVFGALLRTSYGDWWAEYWQYSTNTLLLLWVPQHLLPGWLITALIMNRTEKSKDLSLTLFVGALAALWSPFVAMGLAPLFAISVWNGNWRTLWTVSNLVVGPAIVISTMLLLASVNQGVIDKGLIWQFYPWQSIAIRWPLFCLAEFAIYAMLIAPDVFRLSPNSDDEDTSRQRWTLVWFVLAIVVLTITPIYRMGVFNDFCMRISLPSLFLFWIALIRTMLAKKLWLSTWRGTALWACLAISSLYPVKSLASQILDLRPGLHYYGDTVNWSVDDLVHTQGRLFYRGSADAFFFRHVASTP